MLAMIASVYDIDWNEAEREFKMAMTREPVPTDVRWYYSMYLLLVGRPRESADQCIRGLKDDPLSFMGWFHYAAALLAAGNDAAGQAELRELCALHPSLYQPFYLLGLSLSLQGVQAEARLAAETAYTLAPWNTGTTGVLAGALMRAGERRGAEELLRKLLPGDGYGTPLGLLVYCVMCPDVEQAARWAWKVLEQRDPRLIFNIALLRSPSHSWLRSGDSWSALAVRLGIPLLV